MADKKSPDSAVMAEVEKTLGKKKPKVAGAFSQLERDLPKGGKKIAVAVGGQAAGQGEKEALKRVAAAGRNKALKKLAPLAAGPVGLALNVALEGLDAESAGESPAEIDAIRKAEVNPQKLQKALPSKMKGSPEMVGFKGSTADRANSLQVSTKKKAITRKFGGEDIDHARRAEGTSQILEDDDGQAEDQERLEAGYHAELGSQFPEADEDDLEDDDLTKLMLETSKRELGKQPAFDRPAGDQDRPRPVEIKTKKISRGPASLDTKGKRLGEMSDLEIDAMLAEEKAAERAEFEKPLPEPELASLRAKKKTRARF